MPRKRLTPTTGANSNRTDQPVNTPTGQAYGAAKASTDAQKAVPLPNQAGRMEAMLAAAQKHPMPRLTGMGAPSERPDEPVQAGLPMGLGPGPEALGMNIADNTLQELRAIYLQYPSEDFRELIEELETEANSSWL